MVGMNTVSLNGLLLVTAIFAVAFIFLVVKMDKRHPTKHHHHLGDGHRPTVGGKEVIGAAETEMLKRDPVNPVLDYQANFDKGIHPAVYRDPIRIPDLATGSGSNGFYGAMSSYGSDRRPYGIGGSSQNGYLGPIPGRPMGVPVPAGAMRDPPRAEFGGRESFGSPFALIDGPVNSTPFFTSVDQWAPFRSIGTDYSKIGILTSSNGDGVMNLFGRPIAPAQDLWEYGAQDKNGFFIKLNDTRYLEDGDLVPHIAGKAGLGPWTVHNYVQSRYVWM